MPLVEPVTTATRPSNGRGSEERARPADVMMLVIERFSTMKR
jgi:hypothetical protein